MPDLIQLGYDHFFDEGRLKIDVDTEQLARVTAEHKGVYEVMSIAGSYRAAVTGNRMLTAVSRDDYPAVGDWVVIKNDADDMKVIADILPRKTTLHKKRGGRDEAQLIAANVDVVFIVESIDRDYSLNRFERYLVLAREGGVKPVIVLNKADLSPADDVAKSVQDIRERFGDVEVLVTSSVAKNGLDQLAGYIEKGLTYCFIGSSGVGKSSLINELLEQESIATTAISEKTGRGMHTTTSREMYFMSNGGIIIDNPGSREVGVVNARSGIEDVFAYIETIARRCKFPDCKHMEEPGCAVKQAVAEETISTSQYENYQRLRKESEHYALSAYGRRQKDKKFGRYVKNAKAELNKFQGDSIQD